MFLVDIILENNKGKLKEGSVCYKNEVGELPVQNKEEIHRILKGEFNRGFVAFQNTYMNATVSAEYIESYVIKEVEDDCFKKERN